MQYKIVGPCRVLGVAPGGTVEHDDLVAAGANVAALIGFHLEEVKAPRARAKKED